LLTQEIVSLYSRAIGTPSFALADVADALCLGSELVRMPGQLKKAEFYLNFNNSINLEQMRALKELASAGISVFWDPYVTRNVAIIGGILYELEKNSVRRVDSAEARFNKLGFFNFTLAEAVRAQRLGSQSGFSAVLILEVGGTALPLFVPEGVLPTGLMSRDTVEVAYLSVVGDMTVEGRPSPAEVYSEALAIQLFRPAPNRVPLAWVSAREEIDLILKEFGHPPQVGGKKLESWQREARDAVIGRLRKELIYMETDDERYMYAKIGKGADHVRKLPEAQHNARESAR
jgi:hypothetical protein